MLSDEIFTYGPCACVIRRVWLPIKVLVIYYKVLKALKKSSHMFLLMLFSYLIINKVYI